MEHSEVGYIHTFKMTTGQKEENIRPALQLTNTSFPTNQNNTNLPTDNQ